MVALQRRPERLKTVPALPLPPVLHFSSKFFFYYFFFLPGLFHFSGPAVASGLAAGIFSSSDDSAFRPPVISSERSLPFRPGHPSNPVAAALWFSVSTCFSEGPAPKPRRSRRRQRIRTEKLMALNHVFGTPPLFFFFSAFYFLAF